MGRRSAERARLAALIERAFAICITAADLASICGEESLREDFCELAWWLTACQADLAGRTQLRGLGGGLTLPDRLG